jgi:alpha-aminoadipate carrier protein LysW
LPKIAEVRTLGIPSSYIATAWREEAAMTSCPECENELDIDVDEVEEGDVVACDECGTEYEIVGVEPLELSKVEEGLIEDDEDYAEEEEEEE